MMQEAKNREEAYMFWWWSWWTLWLEALESAGTRVRAAGPKTAKRRKVLQDIIRTSHFAGERDAARRALSRLSCG
jgi:hypothetical protein